jgi:hypothetical protein
MGNQRGLGRRRLLALGAVIVATLAGVDGMAASATETKVPQAIVGCWHRHVRSLPVGTPAGTWLIRISPAGAFAAYTPGSTACGAYSDFTTAVSVVGNVLTIGTVPICGTKGVYAWKATRTALTLRATADKQCPPRQMLLNGVWKKR